MAVYERRCWRTKCNDHGVARLKNTTSVHALIYTTQFVVFLNFLAGLVCVGGQKQMSIATSRALGDFEFKSNPLKQPEEQMISPVPELYTRER